MSHVSLQTLTIWLLLIISAMQSGCIWFLQRSLQKLAIVLRVVAKVQLDMWRLWAWK